MAVLGAADRGPQPNQISKESKTQFLETLQPRESKLDFHRPQLERLHVFLSMHQSP